MLNLSSIQLAILPDVSIQSSVSNISRGYGRRFTVAVGSSSEEVVLKDLFKMAKVHYKSASSRDEIESVDQFIKKLKKAKDVANSIYESRIQNDWIYKIRTAIHRFFGGTYFDSSSSRLDQLKCKSEKS